MYTILRFFRPVHFAISPIFSKPMICTSLHRPSCCYYSKPKASISIKPQTPLFLRQPLYSTSVSELQKWHQWAKQLASSVGSSFVDLDNGPDSSLLCQELKWFMEDALEDHSVISHMGVENDSPHLKNVGLRIEIDELYLLWKQRIKERKPFQYIVGCEHWRDLVLSVQEGVLIPRPETEMIVDLVVTATSDSKELKEGLWADLGTGSGALAIGIGRILEGSKGRVIATDLSPVAVAVASFNVQRYVLDEKIEVRQGSWFEPLEDVKGLLAGLVSNPPYIPSGNIPHLQAEVGRYEPRMALDGGVNGTDDLLYLCDGAVRMLKPGGFFAFETNGENHCKFLVEYLEDKYRGCFSNVRVVSDFAGVQRFVTGFRQEAT